ncbi:MAG: hypothetical protein NZ521_05670 [Flammeovirgaceae bacterium]|nr:hypothetical protein [Flammeovirgaceae bacterium]MDW8287543.1 hypothetical protein [Flammeovirgaceae bacterium]
MKRFHSLYAHFLTRLFVVLAMGFAILGATGCGKSKKKAEAEAAAKKKAEAEAARKRKIDQATADLKALLNDDSKSADELEKALAEIKRRGVSDDPAVSSLIKQVEEKIANKRKEEARKKEEEEAKRKAETTKAMQLEDYFDAIVKARSTAEANKLIEDALKLFSSDNADVLPIIVIDKGQPDYDEPTTARKYLEYLKDQKKNLYKVYKVEKDNNGKIKVLELLKK